MENRTTIWPHDILKDPKGFERDHPDELNCFLICPFTPKEKFDDIFNLIQSACNTVGKQLSCKVNCHRADMIASSGVIHAEIWNAIQGSDIIIADVSGLNGNVMLELGVASACRKKEHVIIIKEDNDEEKFLFDIGPARHIIYKRTFQGFIQLLTNISNSILMALTSAPVDFEKNESVSLPLEIDFTKGRDIDFLISPNITHRRLTEKYLDFGSLYIFRNSWLSFSNLELFKFELEVEMKFSKFRDIEGWIGISCRNQHFFANFGHLFYLTTKGEIIRTVPENDFGKYHDEKIGSLNNFDPSSDKNYTFFVKSNDDVISMYIDEVGKDFKISAMPYVFHTGKILFQTHNCRMGIKSIKLKRLS